MKLKQIFYNNKLFCCSKLKLLQMFIFSFVVIFFYIFCISSALAQTKIQNAQNHNNENELTQDSKQFIRVGISADDIYPFYYSHNGKFVGFDVDLVKEVAGELNLKVQFIELPFAKLWDALDENKVDILATLISETPERNRKYLLSVPYLCTHAMFLFRNEKIKQQFESTTHTKALNIGVSRSTRYHHYALSIFSIKNLKVHAFDDQNEIMKSLENKKIDMMLSENHVMHDFVNRHKTEPYVLSDNVFVEKIVVVAHKNNTELINKINNVLQKMKSDGRLKALSQKYLNSKLLCK